jgi:thiosulfate reductase cytochrome b subunit
MGWMQFLFSFSLLWEKLGASRRLDPFIFHLQFDWHSLCRYHEKNRIPPPTCCELGQLECGNYEMVRLALLFLTIASLNGLFAFGLIAEMRFEFAYLLSLAFFFFGLLTLMSGLFRRSKLPRSNSSLLIYVQKQ